MSASRSLPVPRVMGRALLLSLTCAGCGDDARPPPADDPSRFDAGRVVDAARSTTNRNDAAARPTTSEVDDAGDCVRGQYTVEARPLDMLILLDQSGSMQEDEDRWTPVTQAIESFVAMPGLGATGVALQYFPLGTSDDDKCDVGRYAVPDVPMAPLPGNQPAIASSIAAHYFSHDECCDTPEHSGTPTRPAVTGSAQYLSSWLVQNPTHVGVLLLATDGEPSDVCADDKVDDVADAIAAAAKSSPPVKTYVIGIGKNSALSQMAKAGDTGEDALIVDGSGAATQQQLLDALTRIREDALPCAYPIRDVIDPRALNVEWTSSDRPLPTTLPNVANEAACDGAKDAWYFDDPAAPMQVTLCPQACQTLARAADVTVRIVEGCQTVIAF